MMDASQRKLREATFFYDHLSDTEGEEFGFYFSAFIQAARCVSWVMRYEEKEKYDAWLPSWEAALTPDDLKLEHYTNEWRIDETKRGDVTVSVESVDFQMGLLLATEPLRPGDLKFKPVRVKIKKAYIETSEGRLRALVSCSRYRRHIAKKVKAFLAAYNGR